MKKIIAYSVYSFLLALALTISSCQEEFEELPQPDEEQTIMAGSSTAELIVKTASNDGSFDNIVDGTSCAAIRFPYVVEVNGVEVALDSREDLSKIEDIFDELDVPGYEERAELLEIIFPITITFADFSELVIENAMELRDLAQDCMEGGEDDDIECIDFVYPITLYTFDLDLQQTGKVVVESDRDLRLFFKEREDNDLVSIDFPIALQAKEGSEILVSSNEELAQAIQAAKEGCEEDDNNDYNDDDFTKERLDAYLVECPWLVRDVERDGILQTEQYLEYVMDFSEDGKVLMKNRLGIGLTGTWSTRTDGNKVLLTMDFDNLVDFNLEWYVYELEEGTIKFFSEGGNRIILKRACDLFNASPDSLREILRECSWVISKVENQGEEIRRLLGYELNFQAEGVLTLGKGDGIFMNGTWEVTTNAQGRLVLAMNIPEDPGLSFEWPLADLRDNRIKFEIEDTDYELIVHRVCNNNEEDGDIQEIREILSQGVWGLARYDKEGEEDTSDFEGQDFTFGPGNLLSIAAGDATPVGGLWRVIRDSEGQLKVFINAGISDVLESLTDDWDLVSVTETRIELKDISGDGIITILVFERKE